MMAHIWLLEESFFAKDHCDVESPIESYTGGGDLRAYCSFEDAYRAMRERLRDHATTRSGLFDGDGNVNGLKELLEEAGDVYTAAGTMERLRAFFLGETAGTEGGWIFDTDDPPVFWRQKGEEKRSPAMDGTSEKYPAVRIDAFHMEEPAGACRCEVRTQWENETVAPSNLELTLQKIEIE